MTSACRCFGNPVQKYNKKNEQRKFATRLLRMLLDCYCNATAVLLVIVFPESVILERKYDDLVQLVVHHAGIIVGVDIGLVLPIVQFLHKGTCFVLSAQYGLLQGLDDVRFFVFQFGFLGEDDRIGDVRQIVGRKRRIIDRRDIFRKDRTNDG